LNGEQQLLTVLGLLKFTKDEDSLILLDEPDTHLNPLWKWKYFEYLDKVVKNPDSTQLIINTHDPLVIGNLKKEEVRIFKNNKGKTETYQPEIDPRGLGVGGILTSELFGLPSILDRDTQKKLNEKRYLQGKLIRNDINEDELKNYNELKQELEKSGFYEEVEDIWFKQYLAEMSKLPIFKKVDFTNEEQKLLEKESEKVILEIFKSMEES
jgi:predicted ATP-binding protein involved in virulence